MNIYDLIINDTEAVSTDDIFLDERNRKILGQLVREHTHITELHKYGLPVSNKLLLEGASGCGKTMTAKAIARALDRKIMILNLSNIVCSRIGETSQNIKRVFDVAAREKAVLFLDEFDQIGKARGEDDKDVGEMRRLVNTLIQLIDYYPQNALLICATNHAEIIDYALLRRFQLKLQYELPAPAMLDAYYDKLLSPLPDDLRAIERVYGISYAEARDHAYNMVKATLLDRLDLEAENKQENT